MVFSNSVFFISFIFVGVTQKFESSNIIWKRNSLSQFSVTDISLLLKYIIVSIGATKVKFATEIKINSLLISWVEVEVKVFIKF